MDYNTIVIRNENIVERNIHDSIYLINIKQSYMNDKCCLYEINEMGSYIWNMISGKQTINDIANQISSDMDVQDIDINEIKNDIVDYIELLAKEGFLEVHNGRN